jgi:hypothetical protein
MTTPPRSLLIRGDDSHRSDEENQRIYEERIKEAELKRLLTRKAVGRPPRTQPVPTASVTIDGVVHTSVSIPTGVNLIGLVEQQHEEQRRAGEEPSDDRALRAILKKLKVREPDAKPLLRKLKKSLSAARIAVRKVKHSS